MSTRVNVNAIRPADLRLALFPSLEELRKASLLFKEDKEFQKIPSQHWALTIIMPSKAITLLKKRGMSFKVKEPITEDGPTPEQKELCKEGKAMLFKSLLGAVFFLEKVSAVFEKGNFYVKTEKA